MAVSSVGCRITCVTPSEVNLRNRNKYTQTIIKVVAHKSEEASVGSGTHVSNDRSNFTSRESDCASNVTQVARKQHVDHHRIIRAVKSSSFEPILNQNSCDDYQVRFDPPCVRWS
jgi:hypothetical protein